MNIKNKLFYRFLNFPLYKKLFINKYTETFKEIFSIFLFTKIACINNSKKTFFTLFYIYLNTTYFLYNLTKHHSLIIKSKFSLSFCIFLKNMHDIAIIIVKNNIKIFIIFNLYQALI